MQTYTSSHLTVLDTCKSIRMFNNKNINHMYKRKQATYFLRLYSMIKKAIFPASPEKLAHWQE